MFSLKNSNSQIFSLKLIFFIRLVLIFGLVLIFLLSLEMGLLFLILINTLILFYHTYAKSSYYSFLGLGAILFSYILGIFILKANVFYVPTSSMADTILPGDYIMVDKRFSMANKGAKKQSKFFANAQVQINDVVIFLGPELEGINNYFHQNEGKKKLILYTKRLVGFPGDSLKITENQVFRNNEEVAIPKEAKSYYFLEFNENQFDLDSFLMAKIKMLSRVKILEKKDGIALIRAMIKQINLDEIKQTRGLIAVNFADERDRFIDRDRVMLFSNWCYNEIHQFYIPKAGDLIWVDSLNFPIYQNLPEIVENDYKLKLGRFYLVKRNYYFLKGDNHFSSFDSRYFGLISEKQIIGKVERILWSKFPNKRKGRQWRNGRILKDL